MNLRAAGSINPAGAVNVVRSTMLQVGSSFAIAPSSSAERGEGLGKKHDCNGPIFMMTLSALRRPLGPDPKSVKFVYLASTRETHITLYN